jgi:hypothetical protein
MTLEAEWYCGGCYQDSIDLISYLSKNSLIVSKERLMNNDYFRKIINRNLNFCIIKLGLFPTL